MRSQTIIYCEIANNEISKKTQILNGEVEVKLDLYVTAKEDRDVAKKIEFNEKRTPETN